MAVYLAHHGILGQKWGKKNGPPYPLDAEDHSAAEKKAGWKKSIDVRTKDDKREEKAINKASKIADKINRKTPGGNVVMGRNVLAKYIEEHGGESAVKYVKSEAYKEAVQKAIDAELARMDELEKQEEAVKQEGYSKLKETYDAYDKLIKEKNMDLPYAQGSNVINWFMPTSNELDYLTSDDIAEYNTMADEVYSQMKKWVDMSDASPVSKRQQSINKIEFDDMYKKSKDHDREYGERENFILNSEAMKKFFKDPVVKDVLTMRNRMLDAESSDMVDYGVPTETNRMLRYRANALFGGNKDAVSKVIEMLDTSNDYDESLNPYYNDKAWLYWH